MEPPPSTPTPRSASAAPKRPGVKPGTDPKPSAASMQTSAEDLGATVVEVPGQARPREDLESTHLMGGATESNTPRPATKGSSKPGVPGPTAGKPGAAAKGAVPPGAPSPSAPSKAAGGADGVRKAAKGPAGTGAASAAAAKAPAAPAVIRLGEKKLDHLGDFKLIRKLGQGGMGEVFLAHQVSLDRDVALKVLTKQMADKPNFVDRFIREARTMAKLDHPNIVRGYAVGEEVVEDQGKPVSLHYVAMELIDGKSMQDWLNTLGKIPVGDAVHIAIRVADALQHAHEIHLIHRDIKPDNMLVTSKGVLKVSDLGLAKDLGEDNSMTQSGTGLGTPYYMPPEQARDAKHVDQRSDIYALGSTLYHFLTGKYPFMAESTLELILLKEKGGFPPVKKLVPGVPERLSLIIDKMMSKEPKYRYQTCADLIRDLESLGLANPVLSFVSTTQVPASASLEKSRPLASGSGANMATMVATRTENPMNTGVTPPGGAATVAESTTWYLVAPNAQGKVEKLKMSTTQILAIIKSGQLSLQARASKTEQGKPQPLSHFGEFEQAIKLRAIKEEADKRGRKFEGLYEQIDKEVTQRRRWGWVRRFTESTLGFISLIVWLVCIGILGFAGYWAFMNYALPFLKAQFAS